MPKDPIIFDGLAKDSLPDLISNSNLAKGTSGFDIPLEYKSGSKYDKGILPFMSQQDYRAINQNGWAKLGNGALSLVPLAATDFAGGLQSLAALGVGGAGSLLGGPGAFDYMEHNPINEFLQDVQDSIAKNLPTYHKEDYNDKTFWQKLSDPGFWSDDFVNGLAFSLSAWVPALGAASKLGKAANLTKVISRLGKLAGGLEAAGSAAADATALSELTQGTRFGNYLVRNANQLNRGAQQLTAAFFNRSMESTFEASQTYQQVEKDKFDKLVAQGVDTYSARIQAREAAGKAASGTFLLNYLAMPAEIYEAGLMFKGIHQSQMAGKYLMSALKDPDNYKNAAARMFSGTVAGDAIKGFVKNALAEGPFEENLQQAIQDWQHSKYVDNSKEDFFGGIFGGMVRNFTTPQGGESIGLGAIQGGLMGGFFHARAERGERQLAAGRAEIVTRSLEDLNSSIINNTVKNIFKKDQDGKIVTDKNGDPVVNQDVLKQFETELNSLGKVEGQKNIAAVKGDKNKYDMYKKMQIAQIALAYFNAGIGDEFVNKLLEYGNLSPEEVEQMGIGYMETDDNGKQLSPAEIASKYANFVRQLSSLYNTIETRYPDIGENEAEARRHRMVIFSEGANQLIQADQLQKSKLRSNELQLEQFKNDKEEVDNRSQINNLLDQYETIDDFINEQKDSAVLDESYEKELRKRQKGMLDEIKTLRELEDMPSKPENLTNRAKIRQSLKGKLTKFEYLNEFLNTMVSENELYLSTERYDNYTDPEKWPTFKQKLEEEEVKQEERKKKFDGEKFDESLKANDAFQNIDSNFDKDSLNKLKEDLEAQRKPNTTDKVDEAIKRIDDRIKKIDELAQRKKDEEEALKKGKKTTKRGRKKKDIIQKTATGENAPGKKRGRKKKEKPVETTEEPPAEEQQTDGTTTVIPENINPNPHAQPSDKSLAFKEVPVGRNAQERVEQRAQRSVITLYLHSEDKYTGGYVKTMDGDVQIKTPESPFHTTQEPFLDWHNVQLGDKGNLQAEANNPSLKGKPPVEENLPILVVFKGGAKAYLNAYKITPTGVKYLNDAHLNLLGKGDLTVRERENLDFFNKALANIVEIRKQAWEDFSNNRPISAKVTVDAKTNGQIVNQKDDLRGNPVPNFNPEMRRIDQVYENPSDYEVVVYTNMFGGGFTSNGTEIVPRIEKKEGVEYTPGIAYAMVQGPAFNPNSPFDNRVPIRLATSRLNEMEFGNQAIEAIFQRLSYFKGNNIRVSEVRDHIIPDINQLVYVEGKSTGALFPEISNFLIDYMNKDEDGTLQPRISMKVNDTAYFTFFLRDRQGNPAKEGELFTGAQFITTDERYSYEVFIDQYPDYAKLKSDDLFKKLLGSRFFNVNIKEFQNKSFKFNLLPDTEFADYKSAVVKQGAVKTDLSTIIYPNGKRYPGFYNPEIVVKPIAKVTKAAIPDWVDEQVNALSAEASRLGITEEKVRKLNDRNLTARQISTLLMQDNKALGEFKLDEISPKGIKSVEQLVRAVRAKYGMASLDDKREQKSLKVKKAETTQEINKRLKEKLAQLKKNNEEKPCK